MKKSIIFLCLSFILISLKAQDPPTYHVGIPDNIMDYSATQQQNSQWCWAAAIQMVFKYYHINTVTQEDIVRQAYGLDNFGNLGNIAAPDEVLTASLNRIVTDDTGKKFQVNVFYGRGTPPALTTVGALSQGRPFIISYISGPNTAHAVVITGCNFGGCICSDNNNAPIIYSATIRDPWPNDDLITSQGKIQYQANYLGKIIRAYWFIKLTPID